LFIFQEESEKAERATLTEDDSEKIKSALRKGLLQSRGCVTPNRNERNEDLSAYDYSAGSCFSKFSDYFVFTGVLMLRKETKCPS
jgi:hypothetical protein